MPNILDFSRNRCTWVEQVDQQTMRSVCQLQDTLMDARVEIIVGLPDLDIMDIKADIKRWEDEADPDMAAGLEKVKGVRIGPGMLKIIKGLIGPEVKPGQLAFMVEECCHGIILAFTKETLRAVPQGESETVDFYRDMVKANIRLYNRCAAFASGSSIVEGLAPPNRGDRDGQG